MNYSCRFTDTIWFPAVYIRFVIKFVELIPVLEIWVFVNWITKFEALIHVFRSTKYRKAYKIEIKIKI